MNAAVCADENDPLFKAVTFRQLGFSTAIDGEVPNEDDLPG
jgi:hypothetical protein